MKGCQYFPTLSLLLVFVVWGGWLPCPMIADHHGLGCRSLRFAKPVNGFALHDHVIENISLNMSFDDVRFQCRSLCGMESTCVSINIGLPANDGVSLCQLSNSDDIRHPKDLKQQDGFLYWATRNPCSSDPCLHNATCLNGFTDKRYICLCQVGYTGEHCETDIDDYLIKTHNCNANRICNNTEGSFTCTCRNGSNGNNSTGFHVVFTNLGATGRFGPTSLGSYYTSQDGDCQVTLLNGSQQWTVPYTGQYRIEAIGAAGGYDIENNSAHYRGRGARMIGTFNLSKDENIKILVGQEGGVNRKSYGSGGGGGTFIVRGSKIPLLIAGGGGGIQKVESRHEGCDASTNTTGNTRKNSWPGGNNGHGAKSSKFGFAGGGGGGFYSSGRSGRQFNGTKGYGGEGGKGFLQGGVGGRALRNKADGGFGGGGGATGDFAKGGGGGGGYSGGSSGDKGYDSCGGGGGSFNAGGDQQNECCYNTAGNVITAWNPADPESHVMNGFEYADGILHVPRDGRYYVYAQMYFNSRPHGTANRVNVVTGNRTLLLIHTDMTSSQEQSSSVGGIFSLKAGEKIFLKVVGYPTKLWVGPVASHFVTYQM